jgi:hypothetical protein
MAVERADLEERRGVARVGKVLSEGRERPGASMEL